MSSPDDASQPSGRPRSSRARLRRSARALLRVGAVLTVISLVVALVGGLTTRGLINNLRDNSAELVDGTATVSLSAGAERTLYVTGGLVAPGDDLPTPVEDIQCTVTGPGGAVPVSHLSDEGQRVGLDNPLARFQVVGSFRAASAGSHTIDCNGRGVVVAPEVSPADGLLRLGALTLGSMGTFAGLTLLLIGAVLSLVVRHGTEGDDEDDEGDGALPPSEGAEEWWEDEARARRERAAGTTPDDDEDADEDDADAGEDDYVDLTEEELAALSEEEIDALVASGALVFVDDDEDDVDGQPDAANGRNGGEPFDQDAPSDTYR